MIFQRLLVEPARPERIRAWAMAPWLAVVAVCVGAFMGQLDASIVTLAVVSLRTDLHTSLGAVEWVSLIYLLILVGTVSAVGRLSDMIGRKLIYLYGFLVFTLASLGCGLAPSLAILLIARAVQAVGAAMLQSNSVALIRTTVAPHQLNRAIGFQGAAQALGLALGPAIGGLLIALGGWRLVFFVNLPAGILGIGLGWVLLPRTRSRAARTRFDWPGVITLLATSTSALLALSLIGSEGLSISVILLLLTAAGLAAALIWIERRTPAALINLALFAQKSFRSGISSGLWAYLTLFGVLFVSALYLPSAFGMTPQTTGLCITVLPVFLGIAAPLGGMAADRFGPVVVTVGGMTLTAFAFGLGAATAGNRAALVVVLALAGTGLGLFTPANNAVIASAGPAEDAGMVSGLLNMTRGIGTALGVAVTGAVFGLAASSTSIHAGTLGAITGFRNTMVVLTVTAVASATLSLAKGNPRHLEIQAIADI